MQITPLPRCSNDLDMAQLPSGVTVDFYEELDSTSAQARRRAPHMGTREKSWIIARRQSAGYGRRARSWQSGDGEFTATLSFCSSAPLQKLGELSFVAALAVHDALINDVSSEVLQLKWPNDVLIGGAKVAGLLLEHLEVSSRARILIGIGINIEHSPRDTPYPATCLAAHAKTLPSPHALLARIDAAFWPIVAAWEKTGFGGVRREWLARAAGVGEPIRAVLPSESVDGVFETIDENGALVLRSGSRTRIISAGDVFFGSSANAVPTD